MEPQDFKCRILLSTTGLSPQVVTETLYALAVEQDAPFVPTEIHLITTEEGAEHARLMLLDPEEGKYYQFCEEYGIEPASIAFDETSIHVLTDASGRGLADITTEADNRAVADDITERVRVLTRKDTAVHASIAGGRKTIGFFLAYALSLYGRPQDRLSHVLVSPPFESDPQFYYPPAKPRRMIINGRPVHTNDARIMLADIPFVRLRDGLDKRLLEGKTAYSEAVAAAQRAVDPPELVIDRDLRRIRAGGVEVKLSPANLALLAIFAERAQDGEPALAPPPKETKGPDWGERYLTEYRAICGEMADIDNTEHALRGGMDGDYFAQRMSKLHQQLDATLGPAARPYRIAASPSRPRRYWLDLPPEAIRFANLPEDGRATQRAVEPVLDGETHTSARRERG